MKLFDKNKDKTKNKDFINPNSEEEQKLASRATELQRLAETGHLNEFKTIWEDEYKMYANKQWETTFAKRTKGGRERNYNFADNFIFSTINNMRSSLTSNMPEVFLEAVEKDDDYVVNKLQHIIPHVLRNNKFPWHWRRIINQFIQYGPAIGMVTWDNDWVGGSGPNRWIGEVRVQAVKKEEFFPDPAIVDLEERLQDCGFINRKIRKKLDFFKDRFGDAGELVTQDQDYMNPLANTELEGLDSEQATLLEHWHKSTPCFISKEWKEFFNAKAEEYENMPTGEFDEEGNEIIGFPYKAEEYRDKAKGTFKGVHLAYIANDIVLEYIPYVYQDGLYPFVYRTLYHDEQQPTGIGEIRSIKMTQVAYNMADEIHIGAMAKKGLGNVFYQRGALNRSQLEAIRKRQSMGGQMFEVDQLDGVREWKGMDIPQDVVHFKAEKKNIIDTVSQNTAILQGQSIGSRTPFSVVRELGARADQRNREKIKILSEFYTEMVQLIINRVAEFYTEERQIRIVGEDDSIQHEIARATKEIAKMGNQEEQYVMLMQLVGLIQGQEEQERTMKFSNKQLKKVWERDTGKMEEFIPEYDIKVQIKDARPNDQDYVNNIATMALQLGAIDEESYWQAILEGKLPRVEDILSRLEAKRQMMAQMGQDPNQPRGTPANLNSMG